MVCAQSAGQHPDRRGAGAQGCAGPDRGRPSGGGRPWHGRTGFVWVPALCSRTSTFAEGSDGAWFLNQWLRQNIQDLGETPIVVYTTERAVGLPHIMSCNTSALSSLELTVVLRILITVWERSCCSFPALEIAPPSTTEFGMWPDVHRRLEGRYFGRHGVSFSCSRQRNACIYRGFRAIQTYCSHVGYAPT